MAHPCSVSAGPVLQCYSLQETTDFRCYICYSIDIPVKQTVLTKFLLPSTATMSESDSNLGIIMGVGIGGFIGIVVTLTVCYAKRWCCFAVSPVCLDYCYSSCFNLQCRSDVHEDFNEMSGPRIAEAYRTDVNMTTFQIMTGKQKVPPPPT